MKKHRFIIGLIMVIALPSVVLAAGGAGPCKDVCLLGETRNQDGKSCQLWDASTISWVQEVSVGPGHMHNRARAHLAWLYNWHLAAGGVVGSRFHDATLAALREYASQSDSALNTGVFLASEALRSMVTGSPHAQQSVIQTVQVLHDWWNVAGDPGYLARFAAPVDTDDPIAAQTFETDNEKDHYNQVYNNELWNWRGHISRDQYTGVMIGYSLAYEATNDEVTRALIREDVVEFIEQLMRRDVAKMRIQIDDITLPLPLEVELQYMVFSDDDTENGLPTIMVNTDELTDIYTLGFQLFWPDIGEVVSQIPGFGWVKTLPNPTVAVQLTSHFLVALQVTEGIPEYASRRAAILDFYERHVDDWLDIADKWRNTNRCGEKYYGNNIVFLPMYNLVRLEYNADRAARIRNDILRDRLWDHVAEHKNVLFAHIYASNADPADPIQDITFSHAQQLDLFPPPPLQDLPKDLTDLYPPWEGCPGRSEIATDLDDRLIEYFLWQKDPFELISEGEVGKVNPGHDFLVAYWIGRQAGFIDDDAPNTCLVWRELRESVPEIKSMPWIPLLLLDND